MTHDELVRMKLCEMLSDRPDELCELALKTRQTIVKSANGCSELLYNTYAVSNVFTYSHRLKEAFIHIATYSRHVNLGFNRGKLLPDPQGILEGTGKLIRHIRVESASTLRKPAVKSLITAAINHGLELAESSDCLKPQRFIDKTI